MLAENEPRSRLRHDVVEAITRSIDRALLARRRLVDDKYDRNDQRCDHLRRIEVGIVDEGIERVHEVKLVPALKV